MKKKVLEGKLLVGDCCKARSKIDTGDEFINQNQKQTIQKDPVVLSKISGSLQRQTLVKKMKP